MTAIDPITRDVIQNAVQAIGDEMFAVMRRTAMSPVIYEVLDMGTAITDGEGQLASAGAGIPSFVCVLDKAVQVLLKKFATPGSIAPGDIFITNDPFHGGVTHLNDIALAMPIFADGRLIAWTANIAHWSDVGGMSPGSSSTEAREVFQEGLRLPAVKLFDRGVLNAALLDVMLTNSRLPDVLRGDLWAGVAALRLGERRVAELAGKYGTATFVQSLRDLMDDGESRTRAALRRLPQGHFTMTEELDDGRVIRVAVEIAGDQMIVDLRDNPDQDPGPFNTSVEGALISCQILLKSITDPDSPCSGGSFRPLTVLTRAGSLFHAKSPAALGFYYEPEIRLYDLLWRCLATQIPERLSAGHFSSICGTFITGRHPETGSPFAIVEPQVGGWGASRDGDGPSALFSGEHGETFNCPVEISEARYGIAVEQLALNPAKGGAGRYRGGKGIVVDYRMRADAHLTCGFTRSRVPPWSVDGAEEGTPNYVEIRRVHGAVERHALVSDLSLVRGDVVRIVTGSGGGWGDPELRDPADVTDDVLDGY